MFDVELSATVDAVLQLLLLAMLIAGFVIHRRGGSLNTHGAILAAATLINLGAIAARMIPALLGEGGGSSLLGSPHFLVLLVHIAIGTVAEILALYITIRWARNQFSPEGCYAKGFMGKPLMNLTFVTWILAIGLGLALYLSDLLVG